MYNTEYRALHLWLNNSR